MATAVKPPAPPPFYPIDIPGTVQAAIDADTRAYNLADQDWNSRMGAGFVGAKNYTIKDALAQLTSTPEAVSKDFAHQGIIQSLGAFGAGNSHAGVGAAGSASRNQVQSTFSNLMLDKQDQDRSWVDQLQQMFPERGYGLSGADVANLSIANTGTLNANSAQQYGTNLRNIQATGAAGVQTGQQIAALGGIISSLGSIGRSDRRLKEDIVFIRMHPDGYGIFEFKYIGKEGRYRGVIAQDVMQVRSDVITIIDGYYAVDYGKLGFPMEKLS